MSRHFRRLGACCAALLALTCIAIDAHAEPLRPAPSLKARGEFTDRIIVRLKDEPTDVAGAEKRQPMAATRARALSGAAGTLLIPVRPTGDAAQVVRLTHALPLDQVQKIADKLAREPNVAYAEPDRRKYAQRIPTDPAFSRQWYLSEAIGGINAPSAWDVTTGSAAVVVAVIDGGVIFENPDLQGRLLPGYDFIGSDDGNAVDRSGVDLGTVFRTANDGNGRDPDPSDPGDWISAAEAGAVFADCPKPEDSTWHGTHVTGIIAASANNGFGIAGVDWNTRVLPVRVLGKCGGYTSDILDGARWAAGISVPGVPGNRTPAQVINFSLGGPGKCSNSEQAAIDQILATGGVRAVVTSAGNEAADASNNSPGNCSGVINVGATDRSGNRASYSDFGPFITISAPGGFIGPPSATEKGENAIISLVNCGLTVPIFSAVNCPDPADSTRAGSPHILAFFSGTSVAAPLVTGTVSLMLAANPSLNATDVRNILTASARSFPLGGNCGNFQCGAGIVDANAAVRQAAARPGGINNAPPPSNGGGGGGGGGCTMSSGAADSSLSLLMVLALLGLAWRRRNPG